MSYVNNQKVLVHYLRNSRRIPFGCIVATSPENIGVSICCKKDHFNKRMAKEIAIGRSYYVDDIMRHIPRDRKVYGYYGEKDNRTWYQDEISVYDFVEEAVEYVKTRAKKYFKEEVNTNG